MTKFISRTAAALAVTLLSASPGWATCALTDVASKTWMVSATEITQHVLFFCKLTVNSSGTVASLANGCSDFYPGQNNFNSPEKYNVKSGTIKLISSTDCTFEANLKLGDGSTTPVARFVLDSGKTVGLGNFVVNWGGGGSFNLARIQ